MVLHTIWRHWSRKEPSKGRFCIVGWIMGRNGWASEGRGPRTYIIEFIIIFVQVMYTGR